MSIGYFSSGFLIVMYLLAAHGFANTLALAVSGVIGLLSLGFPALAGGVSREFSGRLTTGWIAGSVAGLIQQLSAWILGRDILLLAFPTSFSLLLLWVGLGGVLGLLGARRS